MSERAHTYVQREHICKDPYIMHICMHGFFQATFTLELFGAELLKAIVI